MEQQEQDQHNRPDSLTESEAKTPPKTSSEPTESDDEKTYEDGTEKSITHARARVDGEGRRGHN